MTPLRKLIAELRAAAEIAQRVHQMLADDKSARNRADGDEGASYSGGTKEQTLEWRAADMLEAQAGEIEKHQSRIIAVFDWAYRDENRQLRYAGLPEVADRLLKRGVKLTPVYTIEQHATLTTGEPT